MQIEVEEVALQSKYESDRVIHFLPQIFTFLVILAIFQAGTSYKNEQ